MLHREFQSPEALQAAIKCFWFNRQDFATSPASFEIQPDGYVEIIFYFGEKCSIAYNGHAQSLGSPFMMGLLKSPAVVTTQNRFEVLAVRCYPWAVPSLLGLPLGKEGVYNFEHPIGELQSSLRSLLRAERVDEAVAILIQYFLAEPKIKMSGSNTDKERMLFQAGAALQQAGGDIPVSQVASTAYGTVRTLERKFKESTGHSVKEIARLQRFERIRNELWLHPEASIAQIAYEMGYSDQSHLSREFKRYSGKTPAAFAREHKHRK